MKANCLSHVHYVLHATLFPPPFLHLSPSPPLPLPLPPSQSRVQILKANLRKSPIAKVPSHQQEGLVYL